MYDAAGRLKTADSWEFEYDANGNRVKSTQDGFLETLATYDTEDRLLSFGNRTYTYDANGARQTQTENGTETRYRYDNLGALKSVTNSGQAIDYITDSTGRRVGRKVNGSVESYFTYQDSLRPIAQYNADGSIRWTIVYAERMNVPSLLISSNGTRYRVVSDHLGSVRLIINTLNGQIVQRMDYDVWGKVTYDSNPNFQPFGFAGGLYDSVTELVRFGARDYDPHVGRWLSKDPIGFAGGDTNLYGYVIQDPVNWVDPSGLSPAYGVCLGREILERHNFNAHAAWDEAFAQGFGDEETRNAEHYLYASFMVQENPYNLGEMYLLTTGYHVYKFYRNFFDDHFAHSPATMDEWWSGIQGANDVLFGYSSLECNPDKECGE